jgi:hypothetical protein
MKHLGRITVAAAGAVMAAFLVAAPASAQNVPNTWEATVLGGGEFGNQIYQGHSTTVDVATAFTYGLRLGYNINRAFEVEVGWNGASSDLNATAYGHGGQNGKIGTLRQNIYEASGLWHWGSRRANGYIGMGFGAITFSPDISGVNASASTKFTMSFVAGGKFSLSPRVALRVEGRLRTSDTGQQTSTGGWCDYYYGCYYYSTNWYNSGELSGGLLVRF